ncbi:MAG: hypothetical protein ACKV2V_03020 [Blastocatellia bacterium]
MFMTQPHYRSLDFPLEGDIIMQVCTWCATGTQGVSAGTSPRSRTPFTPVSGASRSGESFTETALTSIVIGLTAQFIAFLYELTVRGGDNLSYSLLASALAGVLTGAFSFVMIRVYDESSPNQHRCAQCGTSVHQ